MKHAISVPAPLRSNLALRLPEVAKPSWLARRTRAPSKSASRGTRPNRPGPIEDTLMKVFISWSGDKSKATAEALRMWLKLVIQSVEPFVSSVDIAKGDRGLNVIANELAESSFGIICVTRDNNLAPWINFEAGA